MAKKWKKKIFWTPFKNPIVYLTIPVIRWKNILGRSDLPLQLLRYPMRFQAPRPGFKISCIVYYNILYFSLSCIFAAPQNGT